MTSEQFEKVIDFQKKTFPSSTVCAKLAHLEDEIDELKSVVCVFTEATKMEFADCFILLFGAAHKAGMSYEDIVKSVDAKMEINYSRKWGRPDSRGVVHHIK